MNIRISSLEAEGRGRWDRYVNSHCYGSAYHLAGWQDIIGAAYGHKAYYLAALTQGQDGERIVGILPLIQLKHFFFGNRLISMPYVDAAGVLADFPEAEGSLLSEAMRIADRSSGKLLEVRQYQPLTGCSSRQKYLGPGASGPASIDFAQSGCNLQADNRKVGMHMPLPLESKELFSSFKSKLRSQVRKPVKEGLQATMGGVELVDDFFSVLSVNMRDLGSPVHSKKFFRLVASTFGDQARIALVYCRHQPVACGLVLGHGRVLANPWASALKRFNHLSPNMLLYWFMLEYACDQGYEFFDFGRSTPDEGTYKFKQQWGAEPQPLYWYYIGEGGGHAGENSQKTRLSFAVKCWQKLPVSVTKVFGPTLRKHIGL